VIPPAMIHGARVHPQFGECCPPPAAGDGRGKPEYCGCVAAMALRGNTHSLANVSPRTLIQATQPRIPIDGLRACRFSSRGTDPEIVAEAGRGSCQLIDLVEVMDF
jgi:hypothetical protein